MSKYVKIERYKKLKTLALLLLATTIIFFVCFMSVVMAFSFLGFKHQLTIAEYDQYREVNQRVLKNALEHSVVWKMDDTCYDQLQNNGRVIVTLDPENDVDIRGN